MDFVHDQLPSGRNSPVLTVIDRRIRDFRGVAYHRMKSRLTRLTPDSLRDMVTNYDQLTRVMSRTWFARMLD